MICQDHREKNARASVNLGAVLVVYAGLRTFRPLSEASGLLRNWSSTTALLRPLVAIAMLLLLVGCRPYGPTAPTEVDSPAWVTRQHSVDSGFETWRTDPVQVVRSEIARYGASQHWNLVLGAPVMNSDIGRWEVEVRATSPADPDQFVVFHLSQPARQGDGGVWVIHRVTPSP